MQISPKIFNINLKKLMLWLLPIAERTSDFSSLLDWIETPFKHLLSSFLTKRNADVFRLNHNSQVCSMRSMLAEFLGIDFGKVSITDNENNRQIVLYDTANLTIENAANVIIDAEPGSFSNFIVHLPNTQQTRDTEIQAMINIYKLVGKSYQIKYYEQN